MQVPRTSLTSKPCALVVDDQGSMRQLSAAILTRMGFAVSQAVSGKEAVSLCETSPFDAVFLDIEMPEMNGYETAKAIRTLQNIHNDMRLVALSGSLLIEDHVRKCLAHGMNDCLVKPLKEDVLKQRMIKWGFIKG